jgi:hypothetical protein
VSAGEAGREVLDQDARHSERVRARDIVWHRIAHEDDFLGLHTPGLLERRAKDLGIGLAGAGLFARGDGVDPRPETATRPERVELIVVDVAHDAHVQTSLPEHAERVDRARPGLHLG